MGNTVSQTGETPLEPRVEPLGLFMPFVRNEEVTLKIEGKALSWSGDSSRVLDSEGHEVFRIQGRARSMRDKKVLYDGEGNAILNISGRIGTMRRVYIIRRGEHVKSGEKVARVVHQYLPLISVRMKATFTNTLDDTPLTIDVTGNTLHTEAEFRLGGLAVARISREWTNKRQLLGAQTHYITIAPGVDIALMVAICLCIDAKHPGDKYGHG